MREEENRPRAQKWVLGAEMGKKSRFRYFYKTTFREGSVEPTRKVTFRMGSIELSRKVLVRAPFFNFSRRKYEELSRNRLFARVLLRTVAKSPAFTIFFLILITKIRKGESFDKLSPFLLSYIAFFVVVPSNF